MLRLFKRVFISTFLRDVRRTLLLRGAIVRTAEKKKTHTPKKDQKANGKKQTTCAQYKKLSPKNIRYMCPLVINA